MFSFCLGKVNLLKFNKNNNKNVTSLGYLVTSLGKSVTFLGRDVTIMGLTVTDVGLEQKTHELKKHAATIHCSNTLSLLQRKVSNALLYHAYHELMDKEEHEITIKQLCHLISYQGHNHAVIKEALKDLLSTVIEWNLVNDTTGTEDWTASSILASVSLQGPMCYYAYSPRMKQLLHSPSMFGKINLFVQSRFKSSYGLALYENSTRYRGLPFTKWFEIETFRKIMGVPQDKYTVFRDFKRRVLDKSVEEVNTYSDLFVTPEISREGKRVIKIRFALKERAKKIRLGNHTATTQVCSGIHRELQTDYGFSAEHVQQLLQDYDPDFITEKMQLIQSSPNYQRGKVHNLAGYLLSALKGNYQPTHSLTAKKQQASAQQTFELQQQQKALDKQQQAYARYRETQIDEFIQQLSEPAKSEFMQKFFQHAEVAINTVLKLQRNKYSRDTVLESPQIRGMLRQYATEIFSELREK